MISPAYSIITQVYRSIAHLHQLIAALPVIVFFHTDTQIAFEMLVISCLKILTLKLLSHVSGSDYC